MAACTDRGSAFALQQPEQSWTLPFDPGRGCRRSRSQHQERNGLREQPGKSLQHLPAPQLSSSSSPPELPFAQRGRAGPMSPGPSPAGEGQGTCTPSPTRIHPNQQQLLPGHLQQEKKSSISGLQGCQRGGN